MVTKHICSGCGREYPNGGKFCAECGGKIEEKTFQVPDDDGSDTKSARKDNEKAAPKKNETAGVKKGTSGGSPEEIERCKKENTYDAWCRIGHIYQKGDGVPVDMGKALEAYRTAASMNQCRDGEYSENGYAECYIGYFYKSGNQVPKDIDAAAKWFRIATDCGNEYGQYALNTLHNEACECNRKGNVERDNQKNYPAALEWYKKALELDPGYDWPKFNIGYCYMNGYGVNKDGVRAIEWYEKADNYNSWGWIGYMYQYGCGSVAKNISKALEAYQKAVSMNKPNNYGSYQENGWVERQLGLIYKNGDGISQDMDKAVKWFKIAAKCGHKDDLEELSKLGCHENAVGESTKAENKTPIQWIEAFFGANVSQLRAKTGWSAPTKFAYVATDKPFNYGLDQTNFASVLKKLGISFGNYDQTYARTIILFDNGGSTWGSKTNGGIITLDGIWWSEMDGAVRGFEWKDVKSIVQKNGAWKGDFLEINGQYVVLHAMGDFFLGRENFARFLTALSGCQVIKG